VLRRAERKADLRVPGSASVAAFLLLSACSSFGTHQPVTSIPVDASRTASLVSAYRAQNGLGPVSVDSRLMKAAASQARAMGERDRMGHRVAGSLPRRVTAVAYDWGATAENLGAGYSTLDAAMAGWKASGEHRANLLNPHVTEVGVAAVATPRGSKKRSYWALILAAPRPEPVLAGPFGMPVPVVQ
jgi:uncharacterized protein YkwD